MRARQRHNTLTGGKWQVRVMSPHDVITPSLHRDSTAQCDTIASAGTSQYDPHTRAQAHSSAAHTCMSLNSSELRYSSTLRKRQNENMICLFVSAEAESCRLALHNCDDIWLAALEVFPQPKRNKMYFKLDKILFLDKTSWLNFLFYIFL